MIRLRTLTEAECYARCYGEYEGSVRIVHVDSYARALPTLSGEALRRRFEQRLADRDPEREAEAA